jgi:hypothetical protein
MIPSLMMFTLLTAGVLLLLGLPLLAMPGKMKPVLLAWPRNRIFAILTMLLGGGWFLWKILNLGQSDFGDYKNLLFLLFAATLLGSIFYVPDFLAVRGVAILILLSANTGLKSAFGLYDIPSRLVLVCILYLFVVAALYFGTVPYRMRDLMQWLTANARRTFIAGLLLALCGVALLAASALY